MSSALVKLEQIEQTLATITTVEDAKKVRDHAAAFQHYAKTAKLGLTVQNRCAYVKLCAERRAAELLQEMAARGEREGQGGDRRSNSHEASLKLADLGITWDQSSRWQRLTKVTVEQLAALWRSSDQEAEELTFIRVTTVYRDEMRLPEPGAEFTDDPTDERERRARYDDAAALMRMAGRILAPGSEHDDCLRRVVVSRRPGPDLDEVRDWFVAARDRLNWGIAAFDCRLQDRTTPLSFDEKGHVLYAEEGEPLVRIVSGKMAPTS